MVKTVKMVLQVLIFQVHQVHQVFQALITLLNFHLTLLLQSQNLTTANQVFLVELAGMAALGEAVNQVVQAFQVNQETEVQLAHQVQLVYEATMVKTVLQVFQV